MGQAARVFFQPDFGDSDSLAPAVEQNIQAALRSQFDRQAGQGDGRLPVGAFRHGRGVEVSFVNRFPRDGTAQTADKQVRFPGGLGVKLRDRGIRPRRSPFPPANRAGNPFALRSGPGGTSAESLEGRQSLGLEQNTDFQGNIRFIHRPPLSFAPATGVVPKTEVLEQLQADKNKKNDGKFADLSV
jgi:hypothetical protein